MYCVSLSSIKSLAFKFRTSAAFMKGLKRFQRKCGHDIIIDSKYEEIITSVRYKKAISHLGYAENIIFACTYVLEVCLRCSMTTLYGQHFIAICSCGSFFPSTSLSAFCRDTTSYNEIFTTICVSKKTCNS